jgi:GT2 family glycosyltransferase
MNNPLLVIPVYIGDKKHLEVFEACIKTLRKTTDADVLCVDDFSPDKEMLSQAVEFTEKYQGIDWSFNEVNSGFAKTVNVGLRKSLEEKRDCVLVNADLEFIEIGWLEQMGSNQSDIIGAMLLYPNKLIQHAGIYFSILTRTFNHRFLYCMPNTPDAMLPAKCPVTGALQYIKYETLKSTGIYDENFFMGYEDVDYNLRVLFDGGECLYDPNTKALHHESLIRGGIKTQEQKESLMYMMQKYQNKDFKGYVPTMLERNEHE